MTVHRGTRAAASARAPDLARQAGSQQRGYDGYCRDRGLSYELGRALRFRVPDTGSAIVADVVRGRTEFPNNAIEDFVIACGDGTQVSPEVSRDVARLPPGAVQALAATPSYM